MPTYFTLSFSLNSYLSLHGYAADAGRLQLMVCAALCSPGVGYLPFSAIPFAVVLDRWRGPVSDDVTDHDYDDARSSLSDVHDVTVNCPSTVSTSACANYDCDATVVDGSVCVDTAISDNLMQIDTVTVETSVVRDDISKTSGVVPHKDIENCAIETVTKNPLSTATLPVRLRLRNAPG